MSFGELESRAAFLGTGVTSIIERSQLNGALLAIDQINAKGGVLGRPIEPVRYDPASVVKRYGELAEKLIVEDKIDVIFGCYMSSSRKGGSAGGRAAQRAFLLPDALRGVRVFAERHLRRGLPEPEQRAARQLPDERVWKAYLFRRFRLYLPQGIQQGDAQCPSPRRWRGDGEIYFALDAKAEDFATAVDEIMQVRPDAIFSTVVGQSCIEFYKAYHAAGGRGRECPIASLTTNEGEIAAIGPEASAGHITAAPYFARSVRRRTAVFSRHTRKSSARRWMSPAVARRPTARCTCLPARWRRRARWIPKACARRCWGRVSTRRRGRSRSTPTTTTPTFSRDRQGGRGRGIRCRDQGAPRHQAGPVPCLSRPSMTGASER